MIIIVLCYNYHMKSTHKRIFKAKLLKKILFCDLFTYFLTLKNKAILIKPPYKPKKTK